MQGLNLVYKTKVYDKALAYAHKERGLLAQTFAHKLLHARQVHTDGVLLLVDEHNIGVIAIAHHVDHFGTIKSHQFVASDNVNISAIHIDVCKLTTMF